MCLLRRSIDKVRVLFQMWLKLRHLFTEYISKFKIALNFFGVIKVNYGLRDISNLVAGRWKRRQSRGS